MIYIFSHDYRPDAANLRILSYVKYLDSQGRDVTVVFLYPSPELLRAQWRFPHLTIKYLWSANIRERPWRTINLHLRFRLLLMKMRPSDTMFVYGLPEVLPAILPLKKRGVTIYHERTENPELFRVDGTLGSPSMEEYYSLCSGVDRLFVITNALKRHFASHGVPPDKIRIVNMHVDLSRFEGIRQNRSKPVISFCGSIWDNAKDGPDVLIRAFAKVVRNHPEARLCLAGSISEAVNSNLKLIDNLGIRDKVILPGFVSSDNIPQLLSDSSILVLPRPESSQATYGFPSKLGEYLASGNPVIASGIGELPLFLTDKKSVIFTVPSDADDLAGKITWALEHSGEADGIGLNGRRVAELNFNSEVESAKIFG